MNQKLKLLVVALALVGLSACSLDSDIKEIEGPKTYFGFQLTCEQGNSTSRSMALEADSYYTLLLTKKSGCVLLIDNHGVQKTVCGGKVFLYKSPSAGPTYMMVLCGSKDPVEGRVRFVE